MLKKLDDLRGSEAHFSVILSLRRTPSSYKRLGIHVSCEPRYEVKKLYHSKCEHIRRTLKSGGCVVFTIYFLWWPSRAPDVPLRLVFLKTAFTCR